MFGIEYSEDEYAEQLYDAIGFLGRNLRYRDSEKFWNLQYFIRRYITRHRGKKKEYTCNLSWKISYHWYG